MQATTVQTTTTFPTPDKPIYPPYDKQYGYTYYPDTSYYYHNAAYASTVHHDPPVYRENYYYYYNPKNKVPLTKEIVNKGISYNRYIGDYHYGRYGYYD